MRRNSIGKNDSEERNAEMRDHAGFLLSTDMFYKHTQIERERESGIRIDTRIFHRHTHRNYTVEHLGPDGRCAACAALRLFEIFRVIARVCWLFLVVPSQKSNPRIYTVCETTNGHAHTALVWMRPSIENSVGNCCGTHRQRPVRCSTAAMR